MSNDAMQIGRFFSLQRGRVGQYLSPRVLVVRAPFRAFAEEICYFGFDRLNQAQKFAHYLASSGLTFQLRRSQIMPQAYEIQLSGHRDLARTLAYWERLDNQRLASVPVQPSSVNAGKEVAAPVAA